MRQWAIIALIAGLAANAGAAQAGVIFDSTGDAVNGSGSIRNTLGASFSTGAAAALGEVAVVLSDAAAATDTSTVYISLASDAGIKPGFTLSTYFTEPASFLTAAPRTVSITEFAGIRLAANTRYWIVLSADPFSSVAPSSSAKWVYSDNDAGIGVATEYYDDEGISPNSDGPYLLRVSDTPIPASVPEPAWLGSVGLGALTVVRRARRH